jgi:hypothetical protein
MDYMAIESRGAHAREGFAGFSACELKVIARRTDGVKAPEIARRFGIAPQTAYTLL